MYRLLFSILLLPFAGWNQGYFELNHDLDNGMVVYQNVIEAGDTTLSSSDILTIVMDVLKSNSDVNDVDFDETSGSITADFLMRAEGKKSTLGSEYHYRFSCLVGIETKEGKIRYTFKDFMKKSSPGEPGMTLESYIESYQPKIKSEKAVERYALRLDEVELAIHEQVGELIHQMKKRLESEKEDW